jgi:hypothetical protein
MDFRFPSTYESRTTKSRQQDDTQKRIETCQASGVAAQGANP